VIADLREVVVDDPVVDGRQIRRRWPILLAHADLAHQGDSFSNLFRVSGLHQQCRPGRVGGVERRIAGRLIVDA